MVLSLCKMPNIFARVIGNISTTRRTNPQNFHLCLYRCKNARLSHDFPLARGFACFKKFLRASMALVALR